MTTGQFRVAVLSDTHGLLRPEVVAAVRGCDHILHAGDVGDPAILTALRALAPTTAIRGNIDRSGPCAGLPATEAVELAGCLFYLVHSVAELDLNPEAAGIACVVSGHSHKPSLEHRRGVLYLNPGSVGARRFKLPISMAFVDIGNGVPTARIVEIAVTPK